MGAVLDLAERLLGGELDPAVHHPFAPLLELEELSPTLGFVSSFANVTALRTPEGLLLLDASSAWMAPQVRTLVRAWTDAPLTTLVYTHGHIDHVGGAELWLAAEPGARVLAQAELPRRFHRYRLTAGYNACINTRQFRVPVRWPASLRQPDELVQERRVLRLADEEVELRAARGETDDHLWVWLPRQRAVCTGDLFIWAVPNAGNPQKVQRYPLDWANALREMASLHPAILCPGHGPPIIGQERVQRALCETAELLEDLCHQVLQLMNDGAKLDDVLHAVKAPSHLLERPYLRPIYDEPAFIVRNLWRLYGGWWDGNPANLLPASERELATEIATLVGGAGRLVERAQALMEQDQLPLACHLIELAARAAPQDPAVQQARAAIYRRRAQTQTSLMARNLFLVAAEEGGS
ncbi:MAG: alkyl sulfatase dimerization domain-containing protein [Myxococcales bacterium]|nr:MBL fold metallo-hydrolase [Myxococcota bacterium]MDW8280600.1 alkyl sulfatase dimerization domain-containing protein [Myxococcales bacterium]